ncbi:hypothetical protein ANCCAN_00227 [Ancylostoma caninum]|uniref:Uncharacterized protein n=1 Tax=Ancylostoma caninum TaxID=29170 RepID=A0A368HAV2_ANCCA|nr:hypothetical protein ANCCAN_00227 [Ancylostoma caninum]
MFSNVFIRRSMTIAERRREFELPQEAKERNRKANEHLWVVYRGSENMVKHKTQSTRRRGKKLMEQLHLYQEEVAFVGIH